VSASAKILDFNTLKKTFVTKGDFSEFKKEYQEDQKRIDRRFDLLGGQVSRNTGVLSLHTGLIQKNAAAIERNRIAIERNAKAIHRNGLMIEEMQGTLQLILEVVTGLTRRFDEFEKRFDERLTRLENRVLALELKLQ